jgi:phytoene dehydrogenase-like protein
VTNGGGARARDAADVPDAIVVGTGPNGLVAANRLVDAGWSVLVLEGQDDIGGAVRHDREVHPDFVHDTFSAFYPLAKASPSIESFGLDQHGLEWCHAPAVLGHPTPDGEWALLHRDREVTAGLMERQHVGDGEAWLALCRDWDRIGDALVESLLSPFPPVRGAASMLRRLRGVGGLAYVKTLLTPATELGRSRFRGRAGRLLIAGNAGHSDIPLDAPGSGFMGLLLSMLGQTVGFPVPRGGAGELTGSLARRLESRGGRIRCSAEVVAVEVQGGRARGVRLRNGETLRAKRAVVATVVVPHLYGDLVDETHLPARTMRAMRDFQLDPGTVKVDWALDGPVPWASTPAHAPGTFHVADSVAEMSEALAQVASGIVPARPFLLAGQMTTSDPTRSPAGTESCWAYSHVPQQTLADAGEEGIAGRWDHDDCERYADRMQARVERLAPGFTSRILSRRILGPHELEARDANLIGGAINGGTSQLHQELVLRPLPGLGRAETPVPGLFLGSASAHPGGGVHGAPGMNAARAALAHDRLGRLWPSALRGRPGT